MAQRSFIKADCVELLDLWNQSARFDCISEDLLREKVWEDPDFDDELCIVLEEGNRPVGFAVGVARKTDAGSIGYIKLLAVDPEFQGRGLGRELMHSLEDRLSKAGVNSIRVGESAPNYLSPGIDVRYTRAMLMFESLGYQRVGGTYNLTVDLEAQSFDTTQRISELKSTDIEVRRFVQGDSEQLQRLLETHWSAWKPEVAIAKKNDPPSIHVAVKAGAVIAFSAYDSNNLGTGWFGPMGTHPDFRGRGIGEVLLKLCLADIQRQGHETAIIPWVGPVKFYARHAGACIDRVFCRYEKKL